MCKFNYKPYEFGYTCSRICNLVELLNGQTNNWI